MLHLSPVHRNNCRASSRRLMMGMRYPHFPTRMLAGDERGWRVFFIYRPLRFLYEKGIFHKKNAALTMCDSPAASCNFSVAASSEWRGKVTDEERRSGEEEREERKKGKKARSLSRENRKRISIEQQLFFLLASLLNCMQCVPLPYTCRWNTSYVEGCTNVETPDATISSTTTI